MKLGRIRGVTFGCTWCWRDLYVGFYWDEDDATLYFLPLPTCVLWVEFGPGEAMWKCLRRAISTPPTYTLRNIASNTLARKLGAKQE